MMVISSSLSMIFNRHRQPISVYLLIVAIYYYHCQISAQLFLPKRPWLLPNRINTTAISNVIANISNVSSSSSTGIGQSSSSSTNHCLTPYGTPGECSDIRKCFYLILDLTILRQSVCFRNLIIPGVCCPIEGVDGIRPFRPTNSTKLPLPSSSINQSPDASTIVEPIFIPSSSSTTISTSTSVESTTTTAMTTISTTSKPFQQNRPLWNSKTTTKASFIPSSSTTTTTPKPSSSTTKFPQSYPPSSGNDTSFPDDICGLAGRDARIVGGEDSLPGPMALGCNSMKYWCGGAIINQNHIITAAHCLSDQRGQLYPRENLLVKLGVHDLNNDNKHNEMDKQTFNVITIMQHPEFKRNGFYNDLCLLRLDRNIRFVPESVWPICLPDLKSSIHSRNLVGYMATVIGWGTTKYGGQQSGRLQQVSLPVWDNHDCDKRYFQPINQNFLCAGFVEGGKDACQGDSGSPLMLPDQDRRWTIIGIVSFGNRCAQAGYPGVYTRVTQYIDWIRSNV
ncbi:hypothetical protein DERP_012744 [Dermatophagoides pteronyssinus]|uniref:Peptidase S1 domain-containing protein n=1 Tax=Dermatophagoides pteronyssinus TaxID=6956 RepID=A0ABQ8JQ65_DERPT|nr:hypothetical protein DERP_012744 [Dermatophagoides pteronyssinus]